MSLTAEQLEIRNLARKFADERLEDAAREMDRENRFPLDVYKELGDLGFLGLTAPADIGGSEADTVSWALAIEQLARVCPQMADMVMLSKEMSDFVLKHGGPQHREKARAITTGEVICSIALTEPDAGSDAAGIRSFAERVPNGYRLNGGKRFITAGAYAGLAVVLAKTNRDAGHRGITAFLVDTSSPGFSVLRTEDLMGMRGMGTAELAFDSVFIPEENRMGEEGQGFKYIMQALDIGRIGIGSLCVGIAQGALEESLAYAKTRVQFGQPIADFQGVQFLLADMDVRTEASRLLVLEAARKHAAGESVRLEAARAKLFASDTAAAVASDAVQVHGGYGYTKETRVERLYRDVKINQIWEGTNQIMRSVIAKLVLR
jgi:alkylation response protein AidB-like acyl-CoA dehydrogenase